MKKSSTPIAIEVSELSKSFKLPHEKQTSLKGKMLNIFRAQGYEIQKAVNDISFSVEDGDFFGIIGRNGSGKSTLLKMLAGIYAHDTGKIKINGSLIPFIELGVGFNSELSGRDNVYLNGALLGRSREEMNELYDEIVAFSELEKFMDQKLKNYSSGMQVRLAFSIAIQMKSDILLLDEVLAVGDVLFQQKCFNYFEKIKKEKKTVLLVSHDTTVLRKFCNKGILIENGTMLSRGPIDTVLDDYADVIKKKQILNLRGTKESISKQKNPVEITSMVIDSGTSQENPLKDKDNITITGEYKANASVKSPVYGITIRDNLGAALFSSNTLRREIKTKNLTTGDIQKVKWTVPNIFNSGTYSLSAAVTDFEGKEIYDKLHNEPQIFVIRKLTSTGATNPDHRIELIAKKVKKK